MKLILEFSNDTSELQTVHVRESTFNHAQFSTETERNFIFYHLAQAIAQTAISDLLKMNIETEGVKH